MMFKKKKKQSVVARLGPLVILVMGGMSVLNFFMEASMLSHNQHNEDSMLIRRGGGSMETTAGKSEAQSAVQNSNMGVTLPGVHGKEPEDYGKLQTLNQEEEEAAASKRLQDRMAARAGQKLSARSLKVPKADSEGQKIEEAALIPTSKPRASSIVQMQIEQPLIPDKVHVSSTKLLPGQATENQLIVQAPKATSDEVQNQVEQHQAVAPDTRRVSSTQPSLGRAKEKQLIAQAPNSTSSEIQKEIQRPAIPGRTHAGSIKTAPGQAKTEQPVAQASNSTASPPSVTWAAPSGRFPAYGTDEFAKRCPWTLSNASNNCVILARQDPTAGEGLSQWAAIVAGGHMMALQTGCRFLLDYGPNVAVTDITEPFSTQVDWRVPPGYKCGLPKCQISPGMYAHKPVLQVTEELAGLKENQLAAIPSYRSSYRYSLTYVQHTMKNFHDLERTLPGFDLFTGMACSLGNLFQLSPSATKYQPDLFSSLLPKLHSKEALVIAVYIRTGVTETYGIKKEGTNIGARNRAQYVLNCAMHQEQRLLSATNHNKSRVVWMVVTDSRDIKWWVRDSYVNTNVTTTSGEIPREIITTQARGAHTKPTLDPSTADFSEAFLDWYLIGESDVVVADFNGPSFGDTAALRTARPFYKAPKGGKGALCQEQIPVLKW